MRIYKLLSGGTLGIILSLLFLTGVLYADEPVVELEIIPGDEELNLEGPVGADTSFEDGFRLVARGGDVESITFIPSDLTDGDKVIPFWKVTVEPKALSEDKEETFKLVVTGVDEPGSYSGQLRILKPGEPSNQGLIIPIQLTAEATPAVVKVPDTAKLAPSLVRCRPELAELQCRLGQVMAGAASTQMTREIRLENTSLVSALLQPPEITDVRGEKGGYQLTAEDIRFDMTDLGDGTLHSKVSGVLKVTVKANQIPPDEYKGTIRIPVQDQDTPVSIDVDLKVRDGPLVPILVIVLAWLLAHVIKLYPAAERRSRLVLWARAVKEKIDKFPDSPWKKECEKDLETIEEQIKKDKFDDAQKGLEALAKKIKAGPDRVDEEVKEEPLEVLERLTRRVLGWITGVAPEAQARFILWIVRPLIYFAFVAFIIYLGVTQKYTGQATFGANALADYGAIFTWAMSADIVGRSIANWGQVS
jgi:hypothetical protein